MDIFEFEARCVSVLRALQVESQGLTVTLGGQPLVRIEPVREKPRVLGGLSEQGRILQDLVGFDFDEDWEINHS